MTPDEVVIVLEQEIKDWQEACASYENTAQEERKEEGCATLETLKDIQRANEKMVALKSAISLIQDYQKLRDKIDVGKIAGELIEASTFTHTPPNYLNPIKLCFLPSAEIRDIVAQKIVTYLQQPTEHIAR